MREDTIIQKFSVLVGATVTAILFVYLKTHNSDVSNIDKFWISLPIASSMIATDRCIFRRIINLIIKK